MSNQQLINAVVQWEWQAKMAEEKQKNRRGEPFESGDAIGPAAQAPRRIVWPRLARRQTNQPVYAGCTPEQCG